MRERARVRGSLIKIKKNIFVTSFSEHLEKIETYKLFLSEEELALSYRKINTKLQYRSMISFALRRKLLAEQLKTKPELLHFETLKHGKPALKNNPLHFNVSHSENYWCIIFSTEHEVGIDIEETERTVEFLELARRFFHPAETKYLEQLTEPRQAFWKLWTAKEAILKTNGLGISAGLEKIHLSLNEHDKAIIVAPEEMRHFTLKEYQPYLNVVLTVCTS